MSAVVYHSYGTPDVLKVADVDRPEVGKGQVLIRVHASPVTQGDRRMRSADFPGFLAIFGRLVAGLTRPRHSIPGTNFAGDVVEVGQGVTQFQAGDRVFGACGHGAHAQYLCVDADSAFAQMPDGMGYEEIAEMPYGAGTALRFLRDMGDVQPGDRVAIVGAAGGVGRYAVQLAKHFGAEVTAVCRGSDMDFVRDLGADHVVDYQMQPFPGDEGPFDVIFDTSGSLRFRTCRNALSDNGRFLSLVMSPDLLVHMAWTAIRGGKRAKTGVALESREILNDLADLVDDGVLTPVVDRSYPLVRIRDAHERLEGSHPAGSVVVTMGTAG
jgi:NADPH:quinone reductase-like Zn-dependent oxidoreductase